nr:MAG TPA: hypothetical protein [Caudoviricetes sp.]
MGEIKRGFDLGGKEEKGATSSTDPSKPYKKKIYTLLLLVLTTYQVLM